MKNIQLSKRLKYVSDFISPGYILADIGTDHGFIPIYMVAEGKTPKAYAMDINKGPLARAREHIEEADLDDRIETRLSDGLDMLNAGEAESILIAGMGGSLIVKILTEGKAVIDEAKELVLSPHTEADTVRSFLRESDYIIEKEGMVLDAGKYYVVIKARKLDGNEGKGRLYLTDDNLDIPPGMSKELYQVLCTKYGKMLLEDRNCILMEFLEKEKNTYNAILNNLKNNKTEAGIKRVKEVEETIKQIDAALNI